MGRCITVITSVTHLIVPAAVFIQTTSPVPLGGSPFPYWDDPHSPFCPQTNHATKWMYVYDFAPGAGGHQALVGHCLFTPLGV